MESDIGLSFSIPENLLLANPEQMYAALLKSAKETHTNILRSGLNDKPDGQKEVIKYVLLTSDSQLMAYYQLSFGKNLSPSETQNTSHYLSSEPIKGPEQVGVIYDFANNDLLAVQPLRLSYEHLPVAGQYFIEGKDPQLRTYFLKVFASNVNASLKIDPKDAIKPSVFKTSNPERDGIDATLYLTYLTNAQIAIFLLTLLLLVYYGFRESKNIGIYKMNGLSNMRIWYQVIGQGILSTLGISIVLTGCGVGLLVGRDLHFLLQCLNALVYSYVVILAVSIVIYVYISRIKIHEAIKNRRQTNGIFAVNLIFKIVCMIALISISTSTFHQYEEVKKGQKDIQGWEQSREYGIFYPLSIGYDREGSIDNENFNVVVARKLYPVLNKQGSLLINARQYEETALRLNRDYKGIRTIKVNTNYLRQFPVFDIYGKPVQFPESEKRFVLLVPEKYKNQENRINRFFTEDRKEWAIYDQQHYHQSVPTYLSHQQFKIVWLKNNQKIFSFNPDVFPSEGNNIIDPIIQVVTEKNSFVSDLNLVLGNGASDPLKIKLDQMDTAVTYANILPQLKSLKLDDNVKTIVTVNQYMLNKVHTLQQSLQLSFLICLMLIIVFLFILSQNMAIFINKYQQRFLVRKLFGTGCIKTYRELWIVFASVWFIQIVVMLLVNQAWDTALISCILFFILVELLTSVLLILKMERKSDFYSLIKENM